MSCFPKHSGVNEAAAYGLINKLCFQAGFAQRKTKNMPSISKVPKRDATSTTDLPRFMQPSRAARKRNEENLKKREVAAQLKAEKMQEDYMKEQNALAKKREQQATVKFQERLKVNIDAYEEGVAQDTAKLTVSPIKAHQAGMVPQQERFSPIKSRRKLAEDRKSVANAMNAQLAKGVTENEESASASKSNSESELHLQKPTSVVPELHMASAAPEGKKQVRYGGGESFTYMDHAVVIPKLAAKRCYRVLTYANTKQGRQVMDIAEGNLYWCRTGPQKRRITPNAVAFDSRELALSERFPSTQVGAATSGNGTLPRVLVAFDCWGRASRRKGGGGAAKYEFCKFLRIEEFLNSPATGAKKTSERPTNPHYWPKQDKGLLNPRKPIDHSIYIDKRFDTTPWKKERQAPPVSSRTKDLMSSINRSSPAVAPSRVPPRPNRK